MTRSSIRTAVVGIPLFCLLFAAVAKGQRDAELPKIGIPARSTSYVQGFSEIVTVSTKEDAVWLFSYQTGHWHKQAIPANEGKISPTVGNGVVAFRTRTKVYGCSSRTGAWDSVDLGDTRGQPTVGSNMAVFRAGDKLYGFSSETGVWDSIELRPDEVGQPSVGSAAWLETGSKIYAFSVKAGKWAVVDRDNP